MYICIRVRMYTCKHLCMYVFIYVFIYVSKATGALLDSVKIEQIVCEHTVLSYSLPIKNWFRDVAENALYSIKRDFWVNRAPFL